MIGDESHRDVDDGEYASTGGAGGREGSGVTGACAWDGDGTCRVLCPLALGGGEVTLGACSGSDADLGSGGGVELRGA